MTQPIWEARNRAGRSTRQPFWLAHRAGKLLRRAPEKSSWWAGNEAATRGMSFLRLAEAALSEPFVLRAGTLVYTGRAGDGWVSGDAAQAFAYSSQEGAERRAATLNRMTQIHGLVFRAERRSA